MISFGGYGEGGEGTSSGIGVVARLPSVNGVGMSDVSEVEEPGTSGEAPKVLRGRGLEEVRLFVPDILRLRDDEVDPALSREFAGGERIREVGRDGAGEGGAGRVDCSWELERGLVGIGWYRGGSE